MNMGRGTSNVLINVDYFNEIFSKSGMTRAEFALSVGRTKSFVYNSQSRGYMQKPTAILLCNVHGADLDKLLTVETKEPETVQEDNQQQIIFSDEQTIDALLKALTSIDKKLDLLLKK